MHRNSIAQFWLNQPLITDNLSDDLLRELKTMFKVAGEVRHIPDAPGYAVSDDGRVFSWMPCSHKKKGPREVKPMRHVYGYRMTRLQVNKKPTLIGVHRLVAVAFLPPPADGQNIVRHLNGNPSDNRMANLAWGTQADNMQDAIRHGTTLKGMKNPNAKLTPKRIEAARLLAEEEFSIEKIGAFLGVHSESVRKAINGESWG